MSRRLGLPLLLTALLSGAADYQAIRYPVAADRSEQPAMVQWASKPGQPLLVGLHSWSADYKQSKGKTYAAECAKRDWNLIFPNFRGPNKTPQACGSELVVADVLAAVDYALDKGAADPKRVYLLGESGGGYATLLMAARHPERFAGASAWVPIFDLAAWHAETKAAKRKYYKMIEGATGGPPGASPEVDKQYRVRSVKHWLNYRLYRIRSGHPLTPRLQRHGPPERPAVRRACSSLPQQARRPRRTCRRDRRRPSLQ
jgi:pimeloyl-ACP methyl ester carboxylesterase